MTQRILGITVLGDFILSEGVEPVIRNLQRAGVTAVACNPTVTAAAEEKTGSFQPPIDAGSSPRVFDRPLFGQHSLWVRSGVSYQPDPECYQDCAYSPRQPNDLTHEHGHVIGDFVQAAVAAGMKVYFQLGAAQPSGLRDEDRPRGPGGELITGRMADTGSLASEAIRSYNRCYVRDLVNAYPLISGFRIDWPEYPCYTFGEVFQDFSSHVADWSSRHGFDFSEIRKDVQRFVEYLQGGLTPGSLAPISVAGSGARALDEIWIRIRQSFPGVGQWLELKAALSTDLIRSWRVAIEESGRDGLELTAHAFMPPYSRLTGLDFAGASLVADSVSPKLYTMHWSLMIKFWGDVLLQANPSLAETDLVPALVRLTDIADQPAGKRMEDYGYPHPDQPHPVPDAPQQRKIAAVREAINQQASLVPLVHGYGPLEDVHRRLRLVMESAADGVWINRYGYLSNEKIEMIRVAWDQVNSS
ncbi:MAG: hypothetical protein VB877_05330 [Pirellulaceae bacterium]